VLTAAGTPCAREQSRPRLHLPLTFTCSSWVQRGARAGRRATARARARLVGGGEQRGRLEQRLHARRSRRGRGRACQRACGRAVCAAACRGRQRCAPGHVPAPLRGQPIRAESCPRKVCLSRTLACTPGCMRRGPGACLRERARCGVDAWNQCAELTAEAAACTAQGIHSSHTRAAPPIERGLGLPGSPPRATVRCPVPRRARCTADGSRLRARARPAGAAPVLLPGLASAD